MCINYNINLEKLPNNLPPGLQALKQLPCLLWLELQWQNPGNTPPSGISSHSLTHRLLKADSRNTTGKMQGQKSANKKRVQIIQNKKK